MRLLILKKQFNATAVGFLAFVVLLVHSAPTTADTIELVAGGTDDSVNVAATRALLKEPFGCDFDSRGNMWIVEMFSGNRLLRVDNSGTLTHFAGRLEGGFSGDGGPAAAAQFHGPHNLAVGPNGDVYIADTWNGRIRHVAVQSASVSSLPGFEVPIEKAKSSGPYCITLDFTGKTLYVADLRRIFAIDLASGKSSVIAGNGVKGVPADGGLAKNSPLVDPRAVAADRLGNIYILERSGHALRVVNVHGQVRTVVNGSGAKGSAGDSGPGIQATMNGPKHICIDRDNSVLIADAENNLIRRFNPADGNIYRVAGTGKQGSDGLGGNPLKCQLARPHGVTVHPKSGELYITDSYNNRILRIVKN